MLPGNTIEGYSDKYPSTEITEDELNEMNEKILKLSKNIMSSEPEGAHQPFLKEPSEIGESESKKLHEIDENFVKSEELFDEPSSQSQSKIPEIADTREMLGKKNLKICDEKETGSQLTQSDTSSATSIEDSGKTFINFSS